MKVCRCVGCDGHSQQEDYFPSVFYCTKCLGSEKLPDGRGMRLQAPSWLMGDYRNWSQEKQDAYEATNEARARFGPMYQLGREMALRLNKAVWEAFVRNQP